MISMPTTLVQFTTVVLLLLPTLDGFSFHPTSARSLGLVAPSVHRRITRVARSRRSERLPRLHASERLVELESFSLLEFPVELRPRVEADAPAGVAVSPSTIVALEAVVAAAGAGGATLIGDAPDGGDDAQRWLWRGAMLGLTVVWATNFAVIKVIFEAGLTTPEYAAARFTIAAAAMWAYLVPANGWRLPTNGAALRGALRCGLFVSFGYACQAVGLETTSANHSAFICALNVVVCAAAAALAAGQ